MNIDAHKQRCLGYLLWLIFFLNLGLFLSLQTKPDFFKRHFSYLLNKRQQQRWLWINQGVCLVPHTALNYFALCVTDSWKWGKGGKSQNQKHLQWQHHSHKEYYLLVKMTIHVKDYINADKKPFAWMLANSEQQRYMNMNQTAVQNSN